MIKETTSVSVSFVKQAHAAACNEWKRKIEKEFPGLFEEEFLAGSRIQIEGDVYLLTHVGLEAYLSKVENGNVWNSKAMDYSKNITKRQLDDYIGEKRGWKVIFHRKNS
jgi:hypothetical protein